MDSSAATSEADRAAQKVRKLVAMTASPHVEEARTSAYLACRLIREHGLQIGQHNFSSAASPATTEVEPEQDQPSFRRICVRHPSHCLKCGKLISIGEFAFWCRGKGLLHPLCR